MALLGIEVNALLQDINVMAAIPEFFMML